MKIKFNYAANTYVQGCTTSREPSVPRQTQRERCNFMWKQKWWRSVKYMVLQRAGGIWRRRSMWAEQLNKILLKQRISARPSGWVGFTRHWDVKGKRFPGKNPGGLGLTWGSVTKVKLALLPKGKRILGVRPRKEFEDTLNTPSKQQIYSKDSALSTRWERAGPGKTSRLQEHGDLGIYFTTNERAEYSDYLRLRGGVVGVPGWVLTDHSFS